MQAVPQINSGIPAVNNIVNSALPAAAPTASVNPLQVWIPLAAYVWIAGAVLMSVYGIVSYLRLKQKMKAAGCIEANIYELNSIQSPFVLGVFKPKIYIPTGLSEQDREYIITHEQTHIKRLDHLVKFAAYFILCLHWFNPLAWAAFVLMGIDMEMSCDERVLKELGISTKKGYSLSLLSMAGNRRLINGSPLAFSEGGLKTRIKNVLNFKKPSRIIALTAVILAVILSVGFALNRVDNTIEDREGLLYEGNNIYASREAITADEFKRLMYDLQLADDLSTMILGADNINNCNVIVHTGNSDDASPLREPTASILLTLEDDTELNDSLLQWIADLIRSNIPGIKELEFTVVSD